MILTSVLLVMALMEELAASGRGGVPVEVFIALAVLVVIAAGYFLLRKRK